VHAERRRPGVTLELLHLEYLEQHPNGYSYSTFCAHYHAWARSRGATMAPGPPSRRKALRRLRGQAAVHLGSQDRRANRGRAVRRRPRCVQLHLRRGHALAARARLDRQPRPCVSLPWRCPSRRGLRSAALGRHTTPCRYEPGIQRTYEEDGATLRHDGAARAACSSSRQGQGRGGRSNRRALDPARIRNEIFYSL
jgi:hypothetical protein